MVENKIPNIGSLVKKQIMTQKLLKLKRNLPTIMMINILQPHGTDVFNARLAQANLITKRDFDDKSKSLNQEINSNKTKHLLVENELKQLKLFDWGYFRGKSHFVDNEDTKNYLVFQPIHIYFKVIANTKYIPEWKSKALSDESIQPPSTSDNSLSALINYIGNKISLKVNEGCLKQ